MKLWKLSQLLTQLNAADVSAIDLALLTKHIEMGDRIFIYLKHCGIDTSYLDNIDRAELRAEWKELQSDYQGPNHDDGVSYLIELLNQGSYYRVGDLDRVSRIAGVDEAVRDALTEEARREQVYQVQRTQSWWNPVYGLLREGLWHVTSPDGFRGIRGDGWIDGKSGQMSWAVSKNSYGYKRGYNSLFDFETPTEEECIRQWNNAFSVLYQRPINVLLQINRDVLEEKLIANSVALLDLDQHDLVIWFVEAWYPERIPVSAITKGVLFWKSPEVAFTEFTDLQILEQAIDAELQKPQEH